jgi:hypothetical protein
MDTWADSGVLRETGKWPGAVYRATYRDEQFDNMAADVITGNIDTKVAHRTYSSGLTSVVVETSSWSGPTPPQVPSDLSATDDGWAHSQDTEWFEGMTSAGYENRVNPTSTALRWMRSSLGGREVDPTLFSTAVDIER